MEAVRGGQNEPREASCRRSYSMAPTLAVGLRLTKPPELRPDRLRLDSEDSCSRTLDAIEFEVRGDVATVARFGQVVGGVERRQVLFLDRFTQLISGDIRGTTSSARRVNPCASGET